MHGCELRSSISYADEATSPLSIQRVGPIGVAAISRGLKGIQRPRRGLIVALAACMLVACGGGDEESSSTTNHVPTISGEPLGSVAQNSEYQFIPTANDADGDALTFDVSNLPPWATFDASNGEVSGMPGEGDLGTYSNITITVSDGEHSVSLSAFSIEVVAMGSGSATLSWTAPTQRTDGSALVDLTGFRLYWGPSHGNYTNSVELDVGLTTYVIDGLTPATWYFVATAFDSNGIESQFSNEASKTISN
jgi:hypothetical protein